MALNPLIAEWYETEHSQSLLTYQQLGLPNLVLYNTYVMRCVWTFEWPSESVDWIYVVIIGVILTFALNLQHLYPQFHELFIEI